MNLPNLSRSVSRDSVFVAKNFRQIEPSLFCGVCKDAIGGVGKVVIGEGCAEAVAAFELACNAALDWIPGVGEGPSEVACAAGGVVLGIACKAAGGKVTQDVINQVENKVCDSLGLC